MAEVDELHGGHRERLKHRFDQQGLDGFEPHTVLELLLFYALPRVDTNVIAHRLIGRFGSLSKVLEAPKEELVKVKGVGENAATLIKLIPELSRYYLDEKNNPGIMLDSTTKAGEFVRTKFIGRANEITYLVCLDSKGKVIYSEKIADGTVTTTSVQIRTIVEVITRVNAVSIILAHNHPAGFALPSSADLAITKRIQEALKALGVELLDHIIVGEAAADYVSLRDSGYLK